MSAVLVGAIVIGENETIFYPIVTDTRGSVRLVYNNSGHLAMMKNYTTWGEIDLGKSEVIEKGIDRLIILDFANLKRPSIKFPYLFSNSRVYVPSIGEWTTIDPLLLQSPEVFAFDRVKESDGISYAGNDPVNFVDPSGYASIFVSTGGAGGIAEGPRKSRGYIMEASSGFVIGTQGSSIDARGFISAGSGDRIAGLSGGAGLNIGVMFGDVDTMGGRGKSHTVVIGPVGFTMYKNEANEFIGASISPLGKGGGLSSFHTDTNTIVGEGFSLDLGGSTDYQDDGFRFYDSEPSTGSDNFTFGDWSFN